MKFWRKKTQPQPVPVPDPVPQQSAMEDVKTGVLIYGKYVIPEHGPDILQDTGLSMMRKKLIKDPENLTANMTLTNHYVYHSLKAGAKRAGLKFPGTMSELWQLINLEDYARVINGFYKSNGIEFHANMEEQLN